MRMLRFWFTILVMVASLPWGAWLGAGVVAMSVAANPMVALAQAVEPPPSGEETASPDQKAGEMRQCAGDRLPGSLCGAVLAILPLSPDLSNPTETGGFAIEQVILKARHIPEGPTDPPRSC